MEEKRVPIEKVKSWEKNPRNIKTEAFKRLKRQIKSLGVYKRLLVFEENGAFTALGGNMRLLALTELKHKEVDISIVYPKTEAEKVAYSLSDNDRAGEYDELKLTELIYSVKDELELGDFNIDLGPPLSLKSLIDDIGPGDENFTDLDEDVDKMDGLKIVEIAISVPKKFEEEVTEWLRFGEQRTATGLGNGVMKRCGLL